MTFVKRSQRDSSACTITGRVFVLNARRFKPRCREALFLLPPTIYADLIDPTIAPKAESDSTSRASARLALYAVWICPLNRAEGEFYDRALCFV